MVQPERILLRGLSSKNMSLSSVRKDRLSAPRVRTDDVVRAPAKMDLSPASGVRWRLSASDEPFLTQTMQVHIESLPPGGHNEPHGAQTEFVRYILQGSGHDVLDGEQVPWAVGDVIVGHADGVSERHNDGDADSSSLKFAMTSLPLYLGLLGQGRSGEFEDPDARFGPRQEWSSIWSDGVTRRRHIVRPADLPYVTSAFGRIKQLTGPGCEDIWCQRFDLFQQEILSGGSSSKYWAMCDEVVYVISGQAESFHWEVTADIDDKYYARIANKSDDFCITSGDVLWVPPNTVRQHVNSSADQPLTLLIARSSLFRYVGYDRTHIFESATT
jgi:mannose-6-phosphate isomerase-like protein (cupin superfamily)